MVGVSVRTIESGRLPAGQESPPEEVLKQYRESYGGSLRNWVETVRGRSCQCFNCEASGIDRVGYGDSVIVVSIEFPKTIKEKAIAKFQDTIGLDRNISQTPKKKAEKALHDKHGNRAEAVFTCDHCGFRYSHYKEGKRWTFTGEKNENPIYQYACGEFPVDEDLFAHINDRQQKIR
jgi:hypothetical protein